METGIVVAVIAAATSLVGAALSFFFSIRKEREADWRKVKFEHYREFMNSLSSIVGSDASPEGHRRFAQACNTLQLVASKRVIASLHDFRDEIAGSNPNRSIEGHDKLLSRLIRDIRADLGIPSAANPADLSIRLWVSGVDSSVVAALLLAHDARKQDQPAKRCLLRSVARLCFQFRHRRRRRGAPTPPAPAPPVAPPPPR
jgi:hypothetical protein